MGGNWGFILGKRHHGVHPGHSQQATVPIIFQVKISQADWSMLIFTLPCQKTSWVCSGATLFRFYLSGNMTLLHQANCLLINQPPTDILYTQGSNNNPVVVDRGTKQPCRSFRRRSENPLHSAVLLYRSNLHDISAVNKARVLL